MRRFLRRFLTEMDRAVERGSPDALDLLRSDSYPGNVRDLESAIERAVAFASGDVVSAEVLPEHPRQERRDVAWAKGEGSEDRSSAALVVEDHPPRALRRSSSDTSSGCSIGWTGTRDGRPRCSALVAGLCTASSTVPGSPTGECSALFGRQLSGADRSRSFEKGCWMKRSTLRGGGSSAMGYRSGNYHFRRG